MTTTATRQRWRYVTCDFLSTSLAWFVFNIIRYNQIAVPFGQEISFRQYYGYAPVTLGQIFFPLMMMWLYWLSGYYNRPLFRSRVDELLTTAATALTGTIFIYFLALFNDPIPDRASNFELILILFSLLFGVVYAVRYALTYFVRKAANKGDLIRPLAIVGLDKEASSLRRRMEKYRTRGNRIVAYIDPYESDERITTFDGLPVLRLSEIDITEENHGFRGVLVPEKSASGVSGNFSELLNRLFPLDVPILISPSSLQLVTRIQRMGDIAGEPLIDICSARMSDSTRNLKRTGDVVLSALALILCSPLFLFIAAWIKSDSRGPIFYRQERIGYHKKPFRIIKFRTMVTDAEAAGPRLSGLNDKRVTRAGRFLRKYRLDELPQFWNVLKGDMSLVGPRPEREYFISQILKKAPYYSLLHQVRPGLTSWGMVKHGYASNVDEMIERSRFDLIYLENISLIVDLKILLHTVDTVLHGRGM